MEMQSRKTHSVNKLGVVKLEKCFSNFIRTQNLP